jgi:DNA-binding MarR family transcriptional regulator
MSRTDEKTNWLNKTEMAAWISFIETIGDLQYSLDSDLRESCDMTSGDYQVLVYLSESPDRRTRMCDLAARLNLTPSGLTRRLDGLVKEGSVTREVSTEDRRVQLAVLTPQGHRKLAAAAPLHVASVRHRFIDRLTTEQMKHLAAAFTSIREGLSE